MKFRLLIFPIALALTLVGLAFGKVYFREYQQVLVENNPASSLGIDHDRNMYKMPFTASLQQLELEKYASGKLKQIYAYVQIQDGHETSLQIVSVNHPQKHKPYWIYLEDFKPAVGNQPAMVEIKYVRQPGIFWVYIGLFLFIMASLWWMGDVMHRFAPVSRGHFWGLVIGLGLVTTILLLANPMMRHVEVPPILRSVWFLPHVITYVLSYSFLLLAFVFSGIECMKTEGNSASFAFFQIGTEWYTMGLALGMIWAKSAWGDFWGWDPKETAALITWTVCLMINHLAYFKTIKQPFWFVLQWLCLLVLIMGWLGVQWFKMGGQHVY